jgi:GntR family transcriptional regulator, transcriptional repressor for pyruvate dehydrogenase complex
MAIVKKRLSDQVFQELKQMIAEKGFTPGDKFYSENELTKVLDVSRSSIREAIRLLEVSGIVTVRHGKGIYIADPNKEKSQGFSDWLKENQNSLAEHFEIRMMIDPKAAGYAAVKADIQDIQKLEAICEEFKELAARGDPAEMIKIDEQFHLQLAKSTRNRTLYMIMKTMTQSLPEGWISSLHVPGRIAKTVVEHCGIVEAIRNRDSGLAELRMEMHLRNALADIESSINQDVGGRN